MLLGQRQLTGVEGLEHISAARDPFIVALNHSQRPEAVLVPTWLVFFRRGRLIHFLSDWNFLMIPVVSQILRMNEPIIVGRKSAKPRWLNRVKPWFIDARPAMDLAADELRRQRSIGVFPEGTVNRNPHRLLRGLTGTARLSLSTGAAVVPVGIRFPDHPPGNPQSRPITDTSRFSVHIGPPLQPPPCSTESEPGSADIEAWHAVIMTGLSRLSGKSWSAQHPRTKHENQTSPERPAR